MRDWIIANVFRHKCPQLARAKTLKMADGKRHWGYDPQTDSGLQPFRRIGVNEELTIGSMQVADTRELKRLREAIDTYIDQLIRQDLGHIAGHLRFILSDNAAYEAMLDEGERHSEAE